MAMGSVGPRALGGPVETDRPEMGDTDRTGVFWWTCAGFQRIQQVESESTGYCLLLVNYNFLPRGIAWSRLLKNKSATGVFISGGSQCGLAAINKQIATSRKGGVGDSHFFSKRIQTE